VSLHSLKSDGHGEELLSADWVEDAKESDEKDSTIFCIGAVDRFDNDSEIGPGDGDKVGLRVLCVGRCVGKSVGVLDDLAGAWVGPDDGFAVSTLNLGSMQT